MSDDQQEQLGEWLTAYLDGELGDEQRALIERRLAEDASARRLLQDLRQTADLVASLPRHSAPSSILDDLQLHAERSELLSGLGEGQKSRGVVWRPIVAVLSMAAVVSLFVVGLQLLIGAHGPGSGTPGDAITLAPRETNELHKDELGGKSAEPMSTRRAKARSEAPKKQGGSKGDAERRSGGKGPEDGGRGPGLELPSASEQQKESNLLATASFNQKLEAGLGMESVRDHSFSNETVRLKVAVGDETEGEAVTEKLIAYLTSRRVDDLGEVLRDEPGRAASVGSFYYPGESNVNYSETGERQLLVRATRRDLDGLISELAHCTPSGDNVTLEAGPLSIRGRDSARAALYVMDEPAPTIEPSPDVTTFASRDDRSGEKEKRTEHVFDGLIRSVGVDPSLLTDALVPESEPAKASPAAPTADSVPARETTGEDGSENVSPPGGSAVTNREFGGARVADRRSDADRLVESDRTNAQEAADKTKTGKTAVVSIEGGGKEGEKRAGLGEERLSLVDRRARTLEEGDRRDIVPSYLARDPDRPPAVHETDDETTHGDTACGESRHGEPAPTAARLPVPTYVTLIVEIKVAESDRRDGATPARRGSFTGRPSQAPKLKVSEPELSKSADK